VQAKNKCELCADGFYGIQVWLVHPKIKILSVITHPHVVL